MLFDNVTKAFFQQNSYNIFTTKLNNLFECVVLPILWQYAFCKRYKNLKESFFRFYGIHIAQNLTKCVVLKQLYVYQVMTLIRSSKIWRKVFQLLWDIEYVVSLYLYTKFGGIETAICTVITYTHIHTYRKSCQQLDWWKNMTPMPLGLFVKKLQSKVDMIYFLPNL